MPFIKQSSILIRNSFNNLYTISVENGISINYVNSNFEIKKQKNFIRYFISINYLFWYRF